MVSGRVSGIRMASLGVLCAATLGGCASGTAQHEAATVAERFLAAAAHEDNDAACALLTPRTRADLSPCAQSLPADQLTGTALHTDAWSDWAKVDTDDGTLFLTEFDSGWLVAAAGCQPNADAPYRCVVGG